MHDPRTWVGFRLSGHRFALALEAVERVVPAAEVTPLNDAPPALLGLLNLEGRVLPVIDTRQQVGLPARPLVPTDRFLLVTHGGRQAALVVDEVDGLVESSSGAETAERELLAGWARNGVLNVAGETVVTCDVERLLRPAEAASDVAPEGGAG